MADPSAIRIQEPAKSPYSRPEEMGEFPPAYEQLPPTGYPQGGYLPQGEYTHPQGGYPTPGQPQGGYPTPCQPQGGYPTPCQPQRGYQTPGQLQRGYPAAGQPQGAYPTNGQPQPIIIYQTQHDPTAAQVPSIVAAYVTSCFVFWCCNCLFGAIGFFIAVGASSAIGSNNIQKAKTLWKASLIVSLLGILVTAVIVGTVIGVCLTENTACYNSINNNYYG